jgi:hypothetical protein
VLVAEGWRSESQSEQITFPSVEAAKMFLCIRIILVVIASFLLCTPNMIQEFYNTMMYKPTSLKTCHPKLSKDTISPVNIVILIHGRSSNPMQFWKMLPELQLPDIHFLVPHLSHSDASINDDSNYVLAQFNEYISELKGTDAIINVVVVGISKGGLTGADFITKLDGGDPIKIYASLITISSPLHGIIMAPYAFWTKNTKIELDSGSNTVLHIHHQMSRLADLGKVTTYHVVPTVDHIILPTGSAQYHFSKENYVHEKFTSHNNIQNDPDVIKWVMSKIAENIQIPKRSKYDLTSSEKQEMIAEGSALGFLTIKFMPNTTQ